MYHNNPEWLADLSDLIFEGLPEGRREQFRLELQKAVQAGVDLEQVQSKLEARRLHRLIELLRQLVGKHYGHGVDECLVRVIGAIDEVRLCHEAGDTAGLQAAKEAAAEEGHFASNAEEAAKAAVRLATEEALMSRIDARAAAEGEEWLTAWAVETRASEVEAAVEVAAEAARAAAAAKTAAWAASKEKEEQAESAWLAALAAAEAAWAGELAPVRAWEAEAADLLAVLAEAA